MSKLKVIYILCAILFCALMFPTQIVSADTNDGFRCVLCADVSEALNESHDMVSVTIVSESGITYFYRLRKVNDWTTTIHLPDGEYQIVSGGITNDWKNEFPIERKAFTISANDSNFVRFRIGDVERENIDWDVIENPSSNTTDTDNNTSISSPITNIQPIVSENTNNTKTTPSFYTIALYVMLGLLAVIIVAISCVIVMYKKRNK